MSDYFKKREAVNNGLLRVGEDLGAQRMQDNFCMVLNDPAVMGKDTFGSGR